MITEETREEIRRIQSELREPFPAAVHQFREIPGSNKKWVFLPWQVVRDRLDDVCPDWIIDFSDIQYSGNEVTCRGAITILGIRKEAIACVPISVLSNKGNEMTRGSAPDRLMVEAIKNASEQWGVGRYLDDQEFVIRYLWDRIKELDDEKAGEVRRLSEQYKIQVGARPAPQTKPKESGFLSAVSGTPQTINDAQKKRLWAIAKNLKLTDDQIKSVYHNHGFEHTKDISVGKYDQIVKELESIPLPETAPSSTSTSVVDLYPANNQVVKQVRAMTKHDANWILAQCRHYGCDRPGTMPPDKLQKLISDMLVDFAVTSGVVGDRTQAVTSVESALNFAVASRQPILDAALSWLQRYQTTLVSR